MPQHAEVFTIGVEEEYQVIDPRTRALSAFAERIIPRAQELLGDAVQYEINLSQLEVATPICRTLSEVQHELTRLRQGVVKAASAEGMAIAATGTHPFSHWHDQPITPKARYHNLVDDYQQVIREQVIFGCHVHIGLPDRALAAQILSHARLWLAPLLALTASSPFWQGRDTGYSSYRTSLWWKGPLTGPPPYLDSDSSYRDIVKTLISVKAVEDGTRIYWDIRLPERFQTIEFRIMDACMTVREAVLIAGLVRALVSRCTLLVQQGERAPKISNELLRVASWRAARYGLDGDLVDLYTQHVIPTRELLQRFLSFLQPALEAAGDWETVASGLEAALTYGNGARRQREVFRKNERINDVVDFSIQEMLTPS